LQLDRAEYATVLVQQYVEDVQDSGIGAIVDKTADIHRLPEGSAPVREWRK